MGNRDPNEEGDRAIGRSGDLGRGRKYVAKSKERVRGEDRIRDSQQSSRNHVVSLRGQGWGYHRDGLAVLTSPNNAIVGDGDRDGERDEGLKGRTQDRDSSDGYMILRERRPLERAPKPRSDISLALSEDVPLVMPDY